MTQMKKRSKRQIPAPFISSLPPIPPLFSCYIQFCSSMAPPLALQEQGKNCHLPSPSPVRNKADSKNCATPTHCDTIPENFKFKNKCSKYKGTAPRKRTAVNCRYSIHGICTAGFLSAKYPKPAPKRRTAAAMDKNPIPVNTQNFVRKFFHLCLFTPRKI